MAESKDKVEPKIEEEKKHRVRVVASSGNDRRVVDFGEVTEAEAKTIAETVNSAFHVIRASEALSLTGIDGNIVFVNLRNTSFVEVQVG